MSDVELSPKECSLGTLKWIQLSIPRERSLGTFKWVQSSSLDSVQNKVVYQARRKIIENSKLATV